jgi:hypothetical protein
MAMARTQIYLEEGQRRRLHQLARERGQTMAELIREAVTYYLERQDGDDPLGAWRSICGICDSGVTDGSINHDHYVYDE